jgi:hypothetical protein
MPVILLDRNPVIRPSTPPKRKKAVGFFGSWRVLRSSGVNLKAFLSFSLLAEALDAVVLVRTVLQVLFGDALSSIEIEAG